MGKKSSTATPLNLSAVFRCLALLAGIAQAQNHGEHTFQPIGAMMERFTLMDISGVMTAVVDSIKCRECLTSQIHISEYDGSSMTSPKKPRGRNGGRKPENEERGNLVYVPLSLWQDQVDYLEKFGNRSAGARLVIDYVMELKRKEQEG